tara:strand:+ start:4327 stop:4965 length:639 start_codon:yes stop_codon:yes gene_type:complete
MATHFIFDFETIGTNSRKIPAIDVSYTTFEWKRFTENPYTFKELVLGMEQAKFDIKDQMTNHGCAYKKSDLDWWLSQPPELRKNLKPSANDLTASQFMEKLVDYLRSSNKIECWWSRGNTFDPIILDRIAEDAGKQSLLSQYLKHYAVRDTRTFIDAKFNFDIDPNGFIPVSNVEKWNYNFNAHDSKHDVAADILRLQSITRAEHDLEITEI